LKVLIDLHNHTSRCNHADGSMLEYATKAHTQGVSYYGFSDHAPMSFEPEYRMRLSQMQEYEDEIKSVSKYFDGKMKILSAYEVDWLPGYLEKNVIEADVDYLIGSVHFIEDWGFDNPEFLDMYAKMDPDATWSKYFELIADMANSGHFNVVGHIDLLKCYNFLPKTKVTELAKPAMEAIAKAGMAIELNASGLRKPIKEIYPCSNLLSLAHSFDIPVTLSSDAHSPSHVGFGRDDAVIAAKAAGYKDIVIFEQKKMKVLKI
jgi:histidinol-phosphatase (PHP family)